MKFNFTMEHKKSTHCRVYPIHIHYTPHRHSVYIVFMCCTLWKSLTLKCSSEMGYNMMAMKISKVYMYVCVCVMVCVLANYPNIEAIKHLYIYIQF